MKCTTMILALIPTSLLLLIVCLLCAGCGTPPPMPVGDADMRVRFDTVNVKAPPGEGWVYFTEKNYGREYVAFLRRGETPSHQFTADVFEVDRPDDLQDASQFLDVVLRPIIDDYFAGRKFEVTDQETVPDTRFGELGVRFSFEALYYESPALGEAEYLEMRMWGHAFVHPEEPDTMVIIAMNERGHEEEFGEEGKAMGEAFFSGLTLK